MAIVRILIFVFFSEYSMHEWTDAAQVLSADCHTRNRESNNTEEADTNPSKPFWIRNHSAGIGAARAARCQNAFPRSIVGKRLSPVKMSDMEDDFMCDDEEDYDLVRLFKINVTVNACNLTRSRHIGMYKNVFSVFIGASYRNWVV